MSKNGLIVLVPYSAGQDFYADSDDEYEYEYESDDENVDEEEDDDFSEADAEDNLAYLPVYVETEDEDLALMAVAYAACQCKYVTFSSSLTTAEEWKDRGYAGTVENPGVDLPPSFEAFEIPEPGDGFCCASLDDYEVITPVQMVERLEFSKDDYILVYLAKDDSLWQPFNDWCVKFLNYSILSEQE
ncbi:hypothetical protein NOS3756_56840 (plasmid) [Nostoc sp. NIES-3756]|uniref:hypothetical protein n=1 Tax=Nostoc sp. NIES-3756 TaxID=1751286 RepID=UPI000721F344|nr:hypothetical protein [Nostoc sp. NIES-3756]BAT56672.1 hypothetical protein NOS3756_56840 [Nostoc sp. NIES-3756]